MIARILNGNTVVKNRTVLKEPILFANFIRNRHHEKTRWVKSETLTWGCCSFMTFGDKSLEGGGVMLWTKPHQPHMTMWKERKIDWTTRKEGHMTWLLPDIPKWSIWWSI